MTSRKYKATLRTCPMGHEYRKSSDCPTCPTCESGRKPTSGFLSELSAPARRALERAGYTSLTVLSGHSAGEILKLHGIGPSTIPKLERALAREGLAFRS